MKKRETDVIFSRNSFVVAIVLDRSWHLFGGRKFSVCLSLSPSVSISSRLAKKISRVHRKTRFFFFFRPLLSFRRIEKLCQRIRANAFVYTHISRKRRDTHTHTHTHTHTYTHIHAYLTNMLVTRLNLSFVSRYPSAA